MAVRAGALVCTCVGSEHSAHQHVTASAAHWRGVVSVLPSVNDGAAPTGEEPGSVVQLAHSIHPARVAGRAPGVAQEPSARACKVNNDVIRILVGLGALLAKSTTRTA